MVKRVYEQSILVDLLHGTMPKMETLTRNSSKQSHYHDDALRVLDGLLG